MNYHFLSLRGSVSFRGNPSVADLRPIPYYGRHRLPRRKRLAMTNMKMLFFISTVCGFI